MDLVAGLDAAHLGDDVLGAILGHHLGQLLGFVVALHVLEAEGHLDGVEQVLGRLAVLDQLGGGVDEALLAGQLAQGGAADTLDGVLEVRVADALDDLLGIGGLGSLVDTVLGDKQGLGLGQGALDLGQDGLVLEGVVHGALAAVVAVVGGGGVAGVDGEELALDVGAQVVDPVDAMDVGDANVLEGGLFDDPLEELLQCHVEAGVGVLGGHDAVNSRVGVAGALVVALEAVGRGVFGVLDEAGEGVGGADGVLAGDDVQGAPVGAGVDALRDDGSDELEDVGADGAGDHVGGADRLDDLGLVRARVDGGVVGDGVLRGALGADLDDLVRGRGVDLLDQRVHHVGEDDVIAGVVEEAGNEATAWGMKVSKKTT